MAFRLTFGEFEIDEARFELRRLGEAVAVQPKVLDLIVYLARHRERVVTKDELLETVWEGVAVTEASLSQAVSLARRALDDTPEAQHAIRTVRGKGLQFVAHSHEPARRPSAPPNGVAHKRSATPAANTMMETAQDAAPRAVKSGDAPHLFAALHCESPDAGGAGWSLADLDEVLIVRGSERRTERQPGAMTRTLTVTLPGRLMSRQHARLVRTHAEWMIVDERSRNGTFVNGERIEKRSVCVGDVIECGRTLLRFSNERIVAGGGPDADSRDVPDAILPTVIPRLSALARDLERIAPSGVPILLIGESGAGKTHAAYGLHRLSGRRGPLISLDATTLSNDAPLSGSDGAPVSRAHGGTLLIENLHRIPAEAIPRLASAVEAAADVRLVSTSMDPPSELERRVPAELLGRLSGFRCEIPPLRERPGDLGVLVGCLLHVMRRVGLEIDVAAGRALLRHAWPGNIRELARSLEVAAALSGSETICVDHLPPELRDAKE